MGKSKLAPHPAHSMPCLELCAAVLATQMADLITDELDIDIHKVVLQRQSDCFGLHSQHKQKIVCQDTGPAQCQPYWKKPTGLKVNSKSSPRETWTQLWMQIASWELEGTSLWLISPGRRDTHHCCQETACSYFIGEALPWICGTSGQAPDRRCCVEQTPGSHLYLPSYKNSAYWSTWISILLELCKRIEEIYRYSWSCSPLPFWSRNKVCWGMQGVKNEFWRPWADNLPSRSRQHMDLEPWNTSHTWVECGIGW